jgi:hypothetical protein
MKQTLVNIVSAIMGGLVMAILLGWLAAILWNHFPFLETLHHMSLWDGFLLHLLAGLLFKSGDTK